ncbi:leucine-rich melanocyte differentiation-associated protein-like [Rhopilema esculentum]|uniref:leucine-rich melanocyte differentiation-associated protein-like n=1 Tax=Rhopilema esculentum TaxID=499914 RepID=UPI0031D0F473
MLKSAGSRNSQKSIFSQKDDVRSKDESWNLAFRDLNESSLWTILGHHHDKLEKTKTLDLSYNCLEKLNCICMIQHLETLVLDHNRINCNTTFPSLPDLTMLSLNSNLIQNLSLFIKNLATSLPGLRYLSLMKNGAAPSYFNGGTVEQYQDYRLFITSHFVNLEVLDDRKITEEEKAKAYAVYGRRWKLRRGRLASYSHVRKGHVTQK